MMAAPADTHENPGDIGMAEEDEGNDLSISHYGC